jgi:hypothetical protein
LVELLASKAFLASWQSLADAVDRDVRQRIAIGASQRTTAKIDNCALEVCRCFVS